MDLRTSERIAMAKPPKEEFAGGFHDVDHQPDPGLLFAVLDAQARNRAVVAVRDTALRFLRPTPGQRFLDVGCGTGETTHALAEAAAPGGESIGIDTSDHMIEEARRRHTQNPGAVAFQTGSALELAFPDESFDGARSERTFQYLPQADDALKEMVRVVKPGGRIVVIDCDWDTGVMDLPDKPLARRLSLAGSDAFPNGTIGRRLYGMFHRMGLSDIEVDASVLIVTDVTLPDSPIRHLAPAVEGLHRAGQLTADERGLALNQLAEAEASGHFFSAVTMFVVGGTK
jgi:ubiquinone/menaquinone biosynthesis C-methylase UbiE